MNNFLGKIKCSHLFIAAIVLLFLTPCYDVGGLLNRGESAISLPLFVGIVRFFFFGGYPVAFGGGSFLFFSETATSVLTLSVYAFVLLFATSLILWFVRSHSDAEKVKSLTRAAIAGVLNSLVLFLVDTLTLLVRIPPALRSPLSWMYATLYLLFAIALFVLFLLFKKRKA